MDKSSSAQSKNRAQYSFRGIRRTRNLREMGVKMRPSKYEYIHSLCSKCKADPITEDVQLEWCPASKV